MLLDSEILFTAFDYYFLYAGWWALDFYCSSFWCTSPRAHHYCELRWFCWRFASYSLNDSSSLCVLSHIWHVKSDQFLNELLLIDVKVGDELLVDGGMVRFEVVEKIGPDVKCQCTDPGLLLPRANLTFWRDGSLVRERNAMLPTVSSKVLLSSSCNFWFCLGKMWNNFSWNHSRYGRHKIILFFLLLN